MIKKVLIVSTEKRFTVNKQGQIVNIDNTRSRQFWSRYLKVFERVIIVGRVDEQVVTECQNLVENENISVYRIPNYQGLIEGTMKYPSLMSSIKKVLKKNRSSYVLLRLPGVVGNSIAKVLIKEKRKYSVELVGDPFEVFNSKGGLLSKIIANRMDNILRNVLKHANTVAYVTETYLQNRFPFTNGFQTYYSSIELNPTFLKKNKKDFDERLTLIGVGNLEFPYKGVDVLLDALIELSKTEIDFSLTWIGKGRLLDGYKRKVEINNLEKNVVFTGAVPNENIHKLFEVNNIFIMPSLTEGLPRAMIEAMASRLICIGSDVGGIPELIDENCIFKRNDPHAIVKKLISIKYDFNYYQKYSNQNYDKAQEYLPTVLEKKRIKFYESIEI